MKYTDPLSKDHPPCKITNSAMNQWATQALQRHKTEDLVNILVHGQSVGIEAFTPTGMPDTAPRETDAYRRWSTWHKFVSNSHARAICACEAVRGFFAAGGILTPSRDAMLQVFAYEIDRTPKNPR